MNKQQSDAVAEIATTITDKPVPTTAEILAALNRAYSSGYQAGFTAHALYESRSREIIERLMP